MAKRLSKRDKEEINRMAAIIRNSRYPNGYISPHVAVTFLYECGYRKPEKVSPDFGTGTYGRRGKTCPKA